MVVGNILMWAAALAFAAFAIKMLVHIAPWLRRSVRTGETHQGLRWRAVIAAVPEILLLRRLFRENPAIWLGEWVFHASLLLVIIRHLKYFLSPVPPFIWATQRIGGVAGYIMPLSLLYIIIVKAIFNRGRYVFAYNYFLLAGFLLVSAAGVIMRTFFYPDVAQIKDFIAGALRLHAAAAPDSLPFIIHFCLVLIILPFLPTHIFAAPLTIYQAGKRDKELEELIHGGKQE
ncbi:MAG: hypothetical protein M0Z52_08215 [Actinomycetota bacterium]|nr:hypothetical protein [Actinomycetota bacterium]